jgi:hypothetical protein
VLRLALFVSASRYSPAGAKHESGRINRNLLPAIPQRASRA